MLEISGLRFSRRDGDQERLILADLSVTLHQGQHCALVGDSGSGKTTLLNVLAGLEPVQQGSVKVAGNELAGMKADQLALLRRSIGIVFQGFHLLPALTVRHNILLPNKLRDGNKPAPRLAPLCQALGIEALLDRYPDALSGGEQQRVAVARALVHGPDIILADEPTGNLDEHNSRTVVAQMRALAEAQNATLLMVTHSQELAGQFDNLLELHDGKLTWRRQEARCSDSLSA